VSYGQFLQWLAETGGVWPTDEHMAKAKAVWAEFETEDVSLLQSSPLTAVSTGTTGRQTARVWVVGSSSLPLGMPDAPVTGKQVTGKHGLLCEPFIGCFTKMQVSHAPCPPARLPACR
jgi:hypothetical protein